MQLTTGLLLYFFLLTLVLPLIPLTMLFFSIVSLLGLASWVLPTIGSSLISQTGHFQSTLAQLPPLSYRHLVVFHEALSWVLFFSQSMSHLLLQLFPLTVSINGSMLTIHNSFSSFPLHLFLASLQSPAVCFFPSQLVPPQWSSSESNENQSTLLRHQPSTQIAVQPNFYQGCWFFCPSSKQHQAPWRHSWQSSQFWLSHFQRLLFFLLSNPCSLPHSPLILILELLRPLPVLLLVPGWTMPTQFSPAFMRAIFIAFSAFKIP